MAPAEHYCLLLSLLYATVSLLPPLTLTMPSEKKGKTTFMQTRNQRQDSEDALQVRADVGLRHMAFTCTKGLSVSRMRTDRHATWRTNELYGTIFGGKIFVQRGFSLQPYVCVSVCVGYDMEAYLRDTEFTSDLYKIH